MAEYQHIWFKFYGQDWLTDPNIISVCAVDRLIYITLLCLASAEGGSGLIKKISEYSLIKMTHLEDIENNTETVFAEGVLDRLQSHGLIEIKPHVTNVTQPCDDRAYDRHAPRDGKVTAVTDVVSIVLPTYYDRQNSFLTEAERAKKYRDNKKIPLKTKVKKNVTTVTQPRDERHARGEESRVENTIPKCAYGEFKNVKLTDVEKEKVKARYGKDEAKTLVEELSIYIKSKGKDPYKDHYAVLLGWAKKKGLQIQTSSVIPKVIPEVQPNGTVRLVANPDYHG